VQFGQPRGGGTAPQEQARERPAARAASVGADPKRWHVPGTCLEAAAWRGIAARDNRRRLLAAGYRLAAPYTGPVRALLALPALLAALAVGGGAASAAPAALPPKPHVVWKPIPFPARRKAETAEYSKRHYGSAEWRLLSPHVIVEHYTASNSFQSAFATFSHDSPDSELHELPGTCAHFVIDRDGTIYQLVSLRVRCRHTVGLNYTAIGIEHVGQSDAQILGNARQMAASLRLTAWLMGRYGISLGNVIGHNESLQSRYHRELYAGWRCQTHGDWRRADMNVYRKRLARLARGYAVDLAQPRWVTSGC
jgi:N-acetylmuramoyl-L-alanine amidase